ncbi:MAG: enoyl-CoA hydratase/isomerase family protein [Pseudomonadota bacterium]|nr:enoyl-CoA hydratase/isomerase family protein [Pseudomonadota bacterium]
MYETIQVKTKGSVDWLTLNRPERLNAINPVMCEELQDYFGRLPKTPKIRIVVLRGAGRAFCAGYDLLAAVNIAEANAVDGIRFQRQVSEIYIRMRRCPQPIICLAHGATTGGGLAFALASDIRIIEKNTKMNVAMIKIGLTGCDVGISYFLPRSVGSSIAAELMMTGRFIDAERAEKINLVSEVVDIDDLEDAGTKMAEDMLKSSPMGLRFTKEGLNISVDASNLESVVALEDRGQILCSTAGYFKEGIDAFRQKRVPDY